ncbi:MAG: type II secretion system secretin GspD [Gallionellaceae bacterium]|nr:type II secretion system secretin GspD [Gallionellaceae bacterium]
MNRKSLVCLMRALLCAVLLAPFSASAATEENVSLNFVNADIGEVVKAVSHITGRNFLIDPRVKGTINIVSSTPVPAPLAYDILLSSLRLQGFASVESGGVTKIMPEADAKLHAGTGGGKGDTLITRVFTLKYESAIQLVPILRPLIAPNNIVVAYPNSNALVVTDYASNMKRIQQIVESIDQPSAEAPVVIPVKRASAIELAQTINRLMQDASAAAASAAGGDASVRFMLTADARTNSLLVRTDNPARLARVRELADKLDADTGAPGNIHVIYLKNADAAKLAETLRSLLSGDASASQKAVQTSSPTTGMNNTAGNATTAAASTSSASAQSASSTAGMVQADPGSNALIIIAPQAIYNNLRAVVDMLDVRRAQVYVEALIAEVTTDKAAEFGIQWQSLSRLGSSDRSVVGGTNFGTPGQNILGVAGNVTTAGAGLNIGVVRGTLTLPDGTQILNLNMLARAMQTDTDTNVLSTPTLLTLDNEEAKIVIGQNVPFITGSYAQTGTTVTASPFQTIERQDVGITLRIKPQVTEGGLVRLQLYQEVSSVDEASRLDPAGLTTNKRSLESVVLADQGQIIVLGGLIQDQVDGGVSKVPLLGDIPLLGALFRYDTRHHKKTNLMIFIRPYVLRTAEETAGMTQDRYDYLRGEQQNFKLPFHPMLPNPPSPEAPVIDRRQPAAVTQP